MTRVVDVLVLRREHGLLQHPQEQDPSYPELDPQYLPPVQGADQEPGKAQDDVDPAHYAVEGQQGPVSDGKIAQGRQGFQLKIFSELSLIGDESNSLFKCLLGPKRFCIKKNYFKKEKLGTKKSV